jgi:hypothetical protein
VLDTKKDTRQKDVHRPMPSLSANLRNGSDAAKNTRIIKHDIQPSECYHRKINDRGYLILNRHIRISGNTGVTEFRRNPLGSLQLQIRNDASGTLSNKLPGCSFANTAGTARYYCYFTFQSSHHRYSN